MQPKDLPLPNDAVQVHPVDSALNLLSSAEAVGMQLLPVTF